MLCREKVDGHPIIHNATAWAMPGFEHTGNGNNSIAVVAKFVRIARAIESICVWHTHKTRYVSFAECGMRDYLFLTHPAVRVWVRIGRWAQTSHWSDIYDNVDHYHIHNGCLIKYSTRIHTHFIHSIQSSIARWMRSGKSSPLITFMNCWLDTKRNYSLRFVSWHRVVA